jgi:hypothetical protein
MLSSSITTNAGNVGLPSLHLNLDGHARDKQLRVLPLFKDNLDRNFLGCFDRFADGKGRGDNVSSDLNDPSLEKTMRIGVNKNVDLVIQMNKPDFGLFEVRFDPDVLQRINGKNGLARLDDFARGG